MSDEIDIYTGQSTWEDMFRWYINRNITNKSEYYEQQMMLRVADKIDRLKAEVKELKERLAIKDDVICASRLVIEEYERKLKQLRTETSMSVIKDTINDMLR